MKYLLVAEIANHFRCIDMIIDHAKATLTEKFIEIEQNSMMCGVDITWKYR